MEQNQPLNNIVLIQSGICEIWHFDNNSNNWTAWGKQLVTGDCIGECSWLLEGEAEPARIVASSDTVTLTVFSGNKLKAFLLEQNEICSKFLKYIIFLSEKTLKKLHQSLKL